MVAFHGPQDNGHETGSVPVVDLEASESEAVAKVREACLTTGFFYVKNHGISEKLILEQFAKAKEFFLLPVEDKLSIKVNEYYRGYTPMSDEKLDPENQTAADTKEGLYIGREIPLDSPENKLPLHGPNNWPAEDLVPGFRTTMQSYHQTSLACAMRIIRLIALALDLPADHFDKDFTRPIASLRPLHYSASVSSPEKGIFGAGAHTDYGILTILATDDEPGLQILMDNDWIDCPPLPQHLIVNLGDMLFRWTNGKFKSAMHRVVTLGGKERFSTALFVEPNFEAVVAPLPTCVSEEYPAKWPSTTSGEYLMGRYKATHGTYAKRLEAVAA